jgi:hypothetical protein
MVIAYPELQCGDIPADKSKMTQSSLVGRLSWLCLGLSLLVLAAFAWLVPPAQDRFRVMMRAGVPGAAGVLRAVPSIAFMLIPAALAVLLVGVQLRLKNRAAAAIVHLLVLVLALVLFVVHREMMLSSFSSLWTSVDRFAK